MVDSNENQNLENENIKHTEGAEMPDTSTGGVLFSRARADVPAVVAFITSRAVLVPVMLGGMAAGVGYFFYRRAKESRPSYRIRNFLKAS